MRVKQVKRPEIYDVRTFLMTRWTNIGAKQR